MDLIDRQAAIDECYPVTVDGEVYEVVQVETLMGLPSAQPHWIPCSERVPEDVLCGTLVTDGINVWVETWVGIVGKWKYNHSTITAWMPLPEPWKGEEDE